MPGPRPRPPRADRWTQAAWTAAAVGVGGMVLFLVMAAATDGGVRGPVFAVLIAAGLVGAGLAVVALVRGEPRARARFVLGFNLFIGAMPLLLWGLVLLVAWLLGAGEPCETC